MINIEEEYIGLLSGVFHGGQDKEDRTGTGTKSVFGRMLRHDMRAGFPLLTTKKIYYNNALAEILWIIRGRTDLHYLHSNGVKYWDADYERSGRSDGTLGPVYGHQWRNFCGVDQLKSVIGELNKNPTSRRLMVSAWNPVDMPDMVLPPCHHGFQLYSDGKHLDLMLQQRSADLFLGLPYDIAMYGFLLEMIAKGANMEARRLTISLGDCHIYNNHLEQAEEQINRVPRKLPGLTIQEGIQLSSNGEDLLLPEKEDFYIWGYNPLPPIKAELSVGT